MKTAIWIIGPEGPAQRRKFVRVCGPFAFPFRGSKVASATASISRVTLNCMIKTSTWTALRNPVFKRLWVASLISGIWVAAHDTAATWMMNMLTPSPFFLSLMSTVASAPFFLFTLPAGALADMVDRKKLLCLVNLWLAIGAAGLAVLGWRICSIPMLSWLAFFLSEWVSLLTPRPGVRSCLRSSQIQSFPRR